MNAREATVVLAGVIPANKRGAGAGEVVPLRPAADGSLMVTLTGLGVCLSAEQTGTGAEQAVAHGLGETPSLAFVVPTDLTGGVYVVAFGAHDSTYCRFTVTSGEKYRVVAVR
jgi:hypothetical protein